MSQIASVREFVLMGMVSVLFLAGCGGGGGGGSSAPQGGSGNPQRLTVDVSPSSVTVQVGGVEQFGAFVLPNGANQAVTWSVSGPGCSGASCGAIDANGKYTAPATLPNPATVATAVTVSATSMADSTQTATATVTIFFGAGTFTPTGNMTVARDGHSATLLPDGRVLIAGGVSIASALQPPLASAELYDPSTHSFTPTGSMTVPRNSPGAVLLANGKVLIVGGSQDLRAEIYDPSTGAFTSAGNMVSGGTFRVPTLLQDGRVLVEGVNAEIYDPATGVFSLTAAYADANPSWLTSTLLQDGRVLLTGWLCAPSCSGGATELYDPQLNTFSFAGPLKQWSDINTATLLTSGKVLFVGTDDNVDPADAAVYDPAAGAFMSIGNATATHAFAPAVRLADGTVLITGGQLVGGSGGTGSDLYLPTTGTFVFAGNMTAGRSGHTATLLPDGTVLIVGGYGALIPIASAEIYIPKPVQ
jgi:hypothetical protein